jgi:hypothetical protein
MINKTITIGSLKLQKFRISCEGSGPWGDSSDQAGYKLKPALAPPRGAPPNEEVAV